MTIQCLDVIGLRQNEFADEQHVKLAVRIKNAKHNIRLLRPIV